MTEGTKNEKIKKILEFLREQKEPVNLHEISRSVGLSVPSVSKYILYLEGLGLVKAKTIGRSKVVYYWKNSSEVCVE